LFQFIGQIGLVMTMPKLWRWARRLKRGPIEFYDGLPFARFPMVDSVTGQEVFWAVEQLPSPYLPQSRNVASTKSISSKIGQTIRLAQLASG
jgi:hypothetical protein